MPIHDQSYRRYRGRREDARSAWTVIAITGIRSFLRRRAFLGVLLFAWLPFIIRAVQFYLAANYPQFAQLVAPTPQTFRSFLETQNFFVFITSIYVGAGLIANDRRANALQIYLSKPLTRADYIGGKLAILLVFLLLITWVPSMLLLLLQGMFAASFSFVREQLYLLPAITIASLVETLVAAFAMLALSSLSKSSRYVAILYCGIMLFTNAIFGVLRMVTSSTKISWVSFTASVEQVGDVIFRVPPRYETPVAVSFLVLLALVVVSLSVLERRVRGVEVVS
jgi:ABC-2 type transport system permease protein